MDPRLAARLRAGTTEHYADAALYDHEYRRRRADVNYYRALAATLPVGRRDVLELGCGSGRLLVPLVKDGARVVGVDLAQPMLRRCRERLGRLKPPVRARAHLLRADFRRFSLGKKFPLVVCPFNAMMHLYSRDDLRAFLARVREHLTPTGIFAFDVLNPDLVWLTRDPNKRWARTRFKDPSTGKTFYYSTNHLYDAATQIAWIRIYYDPVGEDAKRPRRAAAGSAEDRPRSIDHPGRSKIVHLAHRQFFPQELALALEDSGFTLDAHEGGFGGEPLETDSESQVCRCSIQR